jgi:hypothetical protein
MPVTGVRWRYVVYAFSGTENTLRGYLDGIPITAMTPTRHPLVPIDTTLPLLFMKAYPPGTWPVSWDGDGYLDNVRLYNRALSADEIRQLYVAEGGLNAGLVAYYPFDGNANDASGNGNNGTANGSVAFVPGQSGMAAQFEGGCSVDCGNGPTFQFNTNDFTISAWVYNAGSPNPSGSEIVSKEVCLVQPSEFRLELYQGYMNFWMTDVSSGLPLGDPKVWLQTVDPGPRWAHVAVVRSGLNFAMFVDGREKTACTAPANLNHNNSYDFLIGARYGGACGSQFWNFFEGKIDDVRVHNRALSASELWQLYTLDWPALSAVRQGGNLVLSWPTNSTVFTLVSATNLGPAAVWLPVSPAPVVLGGQFVVTNPITGPSRFFRLRPE